MKPNQSCDLCGYQEGDGQMSLLQHIRRCWPQNIEPQEDEENFGGQGNKYDFRQIYTSQGFRCRHCPKSFNYVVYLQQHIRQAHPFEKQTQEKNERRNLNKFKPANYKPEPRQAIQFIQFEDVTDKKESRQNKLKILNPKKMPVSESMEMAFEKNPRPSDRIHADEVIQFKPNMTQEDAELLQCCVCDFSTKDANIFFQHENAHMKKPGKGMIQIQEFVYQAEEMEEPRRDGSFICQKQGCVFRTLDPFRLIQHQNQHLKSEKQAFEKGNQKKSGKKVSQMLICARQFCTFRTCDPNELIEHEAQHERQNQMNKNKGTAQCLFCVFHGHRSQMKLHYETKHNIEFKDGLTVKKLKQNWSLKKINASERRRHTSDLLEEFRIANSTQKKVLQISKPSQMKFREGSLATCMPGQMAQLDISLRLICLAIKYVMNIHDKWQKKNFREELKQMLAQTEYLRQDFKNPFQLDRLIERALDFGWIRQKEEINQKITVWNNGKKQYKTKSIMIVVLPGQNLNFYFFHQIQSPDVFNLADKYSTHSQNKIEFYKAFVVYPEAVDPGASKKKFSVNKEGKLYQTKPRDKTQPLQSEINKVFHNDYHYCFLRKQDYQPLKKLDMFRQIILQNMWIKTLHQRTTMDNLVAKRGKKHIEYLKQLQEKEYDANCQKYGLLNLRELEKAAEFQLDNETAKRQLDSVLAKFSYGERLREWANLNGITLTGTKDGEIKIYESDEECVDQEIDGMDQENQSI